MKAFIVKHFYDVDGGFGDSVGTEETVAVFPTLKDAKAFVKEYSDPHVYDDSYMPLECGKLDIEEFYVFSNKAEADQAVERGSIKTWWKRESRR